MVDDVAVIRFESNGNERYPACIDDVAEACSFIEVKRFDGTPDLIDCLFSLGSISLVALTRIIVELIRSRRFVSIKINGIEVKGVSQESAKRILEIHYSENRRVE